MPVLRLLSQGEPTAASPQRLQMPLAWPCPLLNVHPPILWIPLHQTHPGCFTWGLFTHIRQMRKVGQVTQASQPQLEPGSGRDTRPPAPAPRLPLAGSQVQLYRPQARPAPGWGRGYLVGLVAQPHKLALLVHLLHRHAATGARMLREAAAALGGLQLALLGDAAPALSLGRVGGGAATALRGGAGGQAEPGEPGGREGLSRPVASGGGRPWDLPPLLHQPTSPPRPPGACGRRGSPCPGPT